MNRKIKLDPTKVAYDGRGFVAVNVDPEKLNTLAREIHKSLGVLTKGHQADNSGFLQGFACVIANLVRFHDQPSLARELCVEAGFSYEDFKGQGIDSYDLKQIRKAFKS